MRRETGRFGHTSDLHQDRQHQRPPARTLLEEPAQLDAQLLRHQSLVGALFDAASLDAVGDHAGRVLEERRGLALVDDEAARDELRLADQRAGLRG